MVPYAAKVETFSNHTRLETRSPAEARISTTELGAPVKGDRTAWAKRRLCDQLVFEGCHGTAARLTYL